VSPKRGMAPIRRDQIVRATIRCLARDGYVGLTMKRVAAEAGVSAGILHYYFPDKRAMLAAAATRVTADLDRRVATAARGARDARARLRALVRACLDVATRDREVWTVFIEFWGETLHDRELAGLNARSYARARRLLAATLARGITEGAFRRIDVAEASAVVLAVLDGLSLQLTFDRGLMSVGRAARLGETALLRYLAHAKEEDAT
jgi:TetR/AcrR family transcriptional regulator, transcriptional repressor of bet genes